MQVLGFIVALFLMSAYGAPIADEGTDQGVTGKKISPRQKAADQAQLSLDKSVDLSDDADVWKTIPVVSPQGGTAVEVNNAGSQQTVDGPFVKKALRQFFEELRNYPNLVQEIVKHETYKQLMQDPGLVQIGDAEVNAQVDNTDQPTWQYIPAFSHESDDAQQAVPVVLQPSSPQQQQQQQQQEITLSHGDQNNQAKRQQQVDQPQQEPVVTVVQQQPLPSQQQHQQQQQQQQQKQQAVPLEETVQLAPKMEESHSSDGNNVMLQPVPAAYYVYPLQEPQPADTKTQKVTLEDGSQVMLDAAAVARAVPAYYYYFYYDDEGESDLINPTKTEDSSDIQSISSNNNSNNNNNVAPGVDVPVNSDQIKPVPAESVDTFQGEDMREKPPTGLLDQENAEADLTQLHN